MCPLILILPFIALPILWLLPLSIGIPLYGIVLALAIAAYVMRPSGPCAARSQLEWRL
jgi:hypothetical protein